MSKFDRYGDFIMISVISWMFGLFLIGIPLLALSRIAAYVVMSVAVAPFFVLAVVMIVRGYAELIAEEWRHAREEDD